MINIKIKYIISIVIGSLLINSYTYSKDITIENSSFESTNRNFYNGKIWGYTPIGWESHNLLAGEWQTQPGSQWNTETTDGNVTSFIASWNYSSSYPNFGGIKQTLYNAFTPDTSYNLSLDIACEGYAPNRMGNYKIELVADNQVIAAESNQISQYENGFVNLNILFTPDQVTEPTDLFGKKLEIRLLGEKVGGSSPRYMYFDNVTLEADSLSSTITFDEPYPIITSEYSDDDIFQHEGEIDIDNDGNKDLKILENCNFAKISNSMISMNGIDENKLSILGSNSIEDELKFDFINGATDYITFNFCSSFYGEHNEVTLNIYDDNDSLLATQTQLTEGIKTIYNDEQVIYIDGLTQTVDGPLDYAENFIYLGFEGIASYATLDFYCNDRPLNAFYIDNFTTTYLNPNSEIIPQVNTTETNIIPEPTSLLLFCIGLVGFISARKRK